MGSWTKKLVAQAREDLLRETAHAGGTRYRKADGSVWGLARGDGDWVLTRTDMPVKTSATAKATYEAALARDVLGPGAGLNGLVVSLDKSAALADLDLGVHGRASVVAHITRSGNISLQVTDADDEGLIGSRAFMALPPAITRFLASASGVDRADVLADVIEEPGFALYVAGDVLHLEGGFTNVH